MPNLQESRKGYLSIFHGLSNILCDANFFMQLGPLLSEKKSDSTAGKLP